MRFALLCLALTMGSFLLPAIDTANAAEIHAEYCAVGKYRLHIGQKVLEAGGCNTCSCLHDGSVACTEIYCKKAPKPKGCELTKGLVLAEGQSVKDEKGCNTCQCSAEGLLCTAMACGQPKPGPTPEEGSGGGAR